MAKKNQPNRGILRLISVVAVAILVLAGSLVFWIGYEVNSACQSSQQQYEGDCVEALVLVVQDEHQSFTVRNDAIWALGQLGDARALPTLEELYSGEIPEREPWGEVVSQYELQKAIALLSGGPNHLAWTWRWAVGK